MRYRINAPQVISETVGDETMIVNLSTGHYFNLRDAGIDVWARITQGSSVSETVADLERRYDAPTEEMAAAVRGLVAELEQEGLIVPRGDEEVEETAVPDAADGERRPFTMPALAKFTDMQDIILLDPVHEVDTRGWPHAPSGG
jgi:hypothetical protein